MGGGDWQEQQQWSCPPCEECSNNKGYYSKLREIKDKPFKEKLDSNLQFMNIVWGPTNLLFTVLLIGVIFHKHIIDFGKNWFKGKGIHISFGKKP